MGIGKMIAKLRREAGYTQKKLAEALHITDKAVSKWERGICLPDSSLLPKLSVLLNVDIEHLVFRQNRDTAWVGFLNLGDTDLRKKIYDKPAIYYILSHFLLADVRDVYIRTNAENRAYLETPLFAELGFQFVFDFDSIPCHNIMALDRPLFLFGADLTRHFMAAMAAKHSVKLVPTEQRATFLFCPVKGGVFDPDTLVQHYDDAAEKTLGRGMLNIELQREQGFADAECFVRLYQSNAGLLLGSIEEIAQRKGLIFK